MTRKQVLAAITAYAYEDRGFSDRCRQLYLENRVSLKSAMDAAAAGFVARMNEDKGE